jgi:hypothetical protein
VRLLSEFGCGSIFECSSSVGSQLNPTHAQHTRKPTTRFGWILVSHYLARVMILILSTTKRCLSSLRNASIYIAKKIIEWFTNQAIPVMDWPLVKGVRTGREDHQEGGQARRVTSRVYACE